MSEFGPFCEECGHGSCPTCYQRFETAINENGYRQNYIVAAGCCKCRHEIPIEEYKGRVRQIFGVI